MGDVGDITADEGRLFVLNDDFEGDTADGRRNIGEDVEVDLDLCGWKIADRGGGRRDGGGRRELVERSRGGTGEEGSCGL